MAKLFATRGCGYVKSAEFIFNFNDTITDVNGVLKDFGSAVIASAPVAAVINMPVGAQVIGGDLVVETPGVGPTAYSLAVGVSGDAACFLAASDLLAAANTRYPFLTTKLLSCIGGKNIQVTMVDSVALATAGRWRLTVTYKLDGQMLEAVPA
jgi:hypothetical protein